MKLNMKKAFTLVEMLIVVIIIGILMAALLPRLKGAQERARDTARKANLSQISTALEMYFNDYGEYPAGVNCTKDLNSALVPKYMNAIPSDPQQGRKTYYAADLSKYCWSWSYAYRVLTKNGAENWWAAVIANVEAEGKVGNRVLTGNSSTPDFTWDEVDLQKKVCDSVVISWNDNVQCSSNSRKWYAKNNPSMVYVIFN